MDLIRLEKKQSHQRIKLLIQQLDMERKHYNQLTEHIQKRCDHEWERKYDGFEMMKICSKCGYI